MSDKPITIVSFDIPERASVLQGELSDSSHPCELVSCEQWLGSAAREGRSALLFYFGRGMPTAHDVERMRTMAPGQNWRAIFEGDRPTKLPRSLLLPPRYFLWPEDREELVDWLDRPDSAALPEQMGLVGQSPAFRKAFAQLRRFALCSAPILITGESGTGKLDVARAAHRLRGGTDRSFMPLFCGTLSTSLAELGVAERQSTTLFLNNLEDLSPKTQVALLAWLHDVTDRARTGDEQAPRIIAGTSTSLVSAESGFRMDLFGLLSVLDLELPPLRHREGDIELLARYFAARFGAADKPLSDALLGALQAYTWPGNLRELENFMHRACVLSVQDTLRVRDAGLPGRGPASAVPADIQPYHAAREETLRGFETGYLRRLMQVSGGNVTQAARLAGVERRSLGRMLKRNRICATPYGGDPT